MKIRNIIALTLLALTPLANAMIPESCPSIASIQKEFPQIQVIQDKTWLLYHVAKFGTADDWTFVMGEVIARNEEEARAKYKQSLESLTLTAGPIFDREFGFTECKYATADGLQGGMINPPIGPDQLELKKLL